MDPGFPLLSRVDRAKHLGYFISCVDKTLWDYVVDGIPQLIPYVFDRARRYRWWAYQWKSIKDENLEFYYNLSKVTC